MKMMNTMAASFAENKLRMEGVRIVCEKSHTRTSVTERNIKSCNQKCDGTRNERVLITKKLIVQKKVDCFFQKKGVVKSTENVSAAKRGNFTYSLQELDKPSVGYMFANTVNEALTKCGKQEDILRKYDMAMVKCTANHSLTGSGRKENGKEFCRICGKKGRSPISYHRVSSNLSGKAKDFKPTFQVFNERQPSETDFGVNEIPGSEVIGNICNDLTKNWGINENSQHEGKPLEYVHPSGNYEHAYTDLKRMCQTVIAPQQSFTTNMQTKNRNTILENGTLSNVLNKKSSKEITFIKEPKKYSSHWRTPKTIQEKKEDEIIPKILKKFALIEKQHKGQMIDLPKEKPKKGMRQVYTNINSTSTAYVERRKAKTNTNKIKSADSRKESRYSTSKRKNIYMLIVRSNEEELADSQCISWPHMHEEIKKSKFETSSRGLNIENENDPWWLARCMEPEQSNDRMIHQTAIVLPGRKPIKVSLMSEQ